MCFILNFFHVANWYIQLCVIVLFIEAQMPLDLDLSCWRPDPQLGYWQILSMKRVRNLVHDFCWHELLIMWLNQAHQYNVALDQDGLIVTCCSMLLICAASVSLLLTSSRWHLVWVKCCFHDRETCYVYYTLLPNLFWVSFTSLTVLVGQWEERPIHKELAAIGCHYFPSIGTNHNTNAKLMLNGKSIPFIKNSLQLVVIISHLQAGTNHNTNAKPDATNPNATDRKQ